MRSIAGVLGAVFVTLKLTGYIDWSWVYVTMPFWLGISVVLVMTIPFLTVGLIESLKKK